MMLRAEHDSSTLPPMIDTHCHLDDRQFADDLADVLEAARMAGVDRWILIGYDPDHWQQAIELARQTPGMVHTLGVHPACAQDWSPLVEEQLARLLTESHAVGVGECGIDLYRDNAPLDIQAAVFSRQLDIAAALDLPVVIHMRSAEAEVLDLLRRRSINPTLLFHSFEGSDDLMDYALETNSYVGVGGLATRAKSDVLRGVLARAPLDRIVLETDSPYLVPAKQKDRRNQPAHIRTIAMMMAECFGTTPAQLAEQTTHNAETLFGLHHD